MYIARLSYLYALQLLSQSLIHGVRAYGKGIALIIYPQQVTAPSCLNHGYELKGLHIQLRPCHVFLNGLTETDGQLLGCVAGNSLWRIRHKRIGHADLQYLVNKLLRRKNAGIRNHRKTFFVTDDFHQLHQVCVLHLLADLGVAQETAIYSQGGVKGIQAGAHLHALHLFYGIPGSKHDACMLQPGASVGERILNHQVFSFLCIDKRSHICVLAGDNALCICKACLLQHLLDAVIRTWGDFVNHAPREGNMRRILNILQKSAVSLSVLCPCLCISVHSRIQLIAVVGTVIHADQGQRSCAMGISPVTQGGELTDITICLFRTSLKISLYVRAEGPVCRSDAVALFCDGEADHLQGFTGKNIL